MISRSVRPDLLAGLLLAAALSPAARAQEAHVHGVSRVEIALDGEVLHLGVHMPGLDAVGFERAPATATERAAVDAAMGRLRSVADWLSFDPAGACVVVRAEVEAPGFAADATAGADPQAGDDMAQHAARDHHGDHHRGSGSDGDGDGDHGLASTGHEGHAGLVVTIEARCAGEPSALELRLDELFPSIEQVQADVLTASAQTRTVLSAGRSRIPLQ